MNIADDADRLQTLLYSAYDSDTVRDMERPLLDDGVPLMRMAGSAAAHVTMCQTARCSTTRISPSKMRA